MARIEQDLHLISNFRYRKEQTNKQKNELD